jgi:hypothetical protein
MEFFELISFADEEKITGGNPNLTNNPSEVYLPSFGGTNYGQAKKNGGGGLGNPSVRYEGTNYGQYKKANS